MEWEPGANGYLEWYLDDELIFGIPGESLQALTGSHIPDEPMYLILNTAISHRWGFPEPCDVSTCSSCWICYDCTHPDCQCTLPNGMKNCKNLPAEMSIDYIRLYQDTSKKSSHSIGCSPKTHPTKGYIEANYPLYKNWEPYNAGSASILGGIGSAGDFSFISLLHFIGAFGLFVILVFGLYRLYQELYRLCYPYQRLNGPQEHNYRSLSDNSLAHLLPISNQNPNSLSNNRNVNNNNYRSDSLKQPYSSNPSSNKYITVENDDMIALVTVPSPNKTKILSGGSGLSGNNSGQNSYQNSTTSLSELNLNIRRSRGRE